MTCGICTYTVVPIFDLINHVWEIPGFPRWYFQPCPILPGKYQEILFITSIISFYLIVNFGTVCIIMITRYYTDTCIYSECKQKSSDKSLFWYLLININIFISNTYMQIRIHTKSLYFIIYDTQVYHFTMSAI